MHCTLLIPDLLLTSPSDADLYRDLHLPVLTRLLARGTCSSDDPLSMENWLCAEFEVKRQHDWPIAALTLTSDGIDPGESYWLRCDPAHLRAQRSQLLLAGSDMAAPTADEASALIGSLNAHFAADAMSIIAPHPQRWYLNLARAPALCTREFPEVVGKDIDPHLPTGDDGMRWHSWLNETQMLLHEHPVNQARAALNKPAINSVWLWGGGVVPASCGRPYAHVWSDDPLARALAVRSVGSAYALPGTAAALFDTLASAADHHLVVMPQLRSAAGSAEFDRWCAGLRALEQDWFAPLHAALRQRKLSGLTLIVLGAKRCLRCEVAAGDLWKFWRPSRPLAHHA